MFSYWRNKINGICHMSLANTVWPSDMWDRISDEEYYEWKARRHTMTTPANENEAAAIIHGAFNVKEHALQAIVEQEWDSALKESAFARFEIDHENEPLEEITAARAALRELLTRQRDWEARLLAFVERVAESATTNVTEWTKTENNSLAERHRLVLAIRDLDSLGDQARVLLATDTPPPR